MSRVSVRTGWGAGAQSAPRGRDGCNKESTTMVTTRAASCAEVSLSPDANLLSVDLEPWAGGSYREETLFLIELFRRKKATATFFDG